MIFECYESTEEKAWKNSPDSSGYAICSLAFEAEQ